MLPIEPLSADRGSELSHGRRDASRGTAEMRNDLLRKFIDCDVSAPRAQPSVRSYHRCELDRIGEMRNLKNKMWKYGSFGGTERSLTSATYFDTSKPGYVT